MNNEKSLPATLLVRSVVVVRSVDEAYRVAQAMHRLGGITDVADAKTQRTVIDFSDLLLHTCAQS